MDCSRRRAPWADGGGKRRGDETVMRILLLDAHENRAEATGDGSCVAPVKWGVEETGPKFGERSDDISTALPEVLIGTIGSIFHEDVCGDDEETISGQLDTKSRRVLCSRRQPHICRQKLM